MKHSRSGTAVQVLASGYRAKTKIKEIIRVTAEHCEVEEQFICGPSRQRRIAGARQIAFWLTRQLTTLSYPEIGRMFGGRHHTVPWKAVCQVDQLRKSHPQTRALTDEILEALGETAT